ncbi:VOC family protein [Legionella israelensis]|uniref:VOC family protein n=1 Tax=Legionella israelensis TaxID=454 RepID=A0AAX1EEG8_9GAMM|nr:VOC family protein [Legionella israelensis]QBR83453.1 VOC family protein [Legionella israelensis]
MSQRNTFCWIDIPVIDLDRAISFYEVMLDEKVEKITEHGFEFGLLPHTEDNVSGCLVVMDDRNPSRNGPLVYLNVEGRMDKAIAAVKNNGGKLLKRKEQIGPYGYRAVILDTEGNAIALYSKKDDSP